MNHIINEVKKMILDFPDSSEVKKGHIAIVVKYSLFLAKKLGGDKEIIGISAWLHDIDKLKGGKEGHHIRGAKEAELILRKFGYPEKKIKKVHDCILKHSSDKNFPPKSLEQKILASADAMEHFDDFISRIYYYAKKGFTLDETKEKILKKADKSYSKMMPYAKKLVKKKYDAIKLLVKK